MSISPYFYIEYYNHKMGVWEKLDIYIRSKSGKFTPVDIWPWNGTHNLFSILEDEGAYPYFYAIHTGLPVNCSDEMQRIFESQSDYLEEFIRTPNVKWFNLADAMLYVKEHPTVMDYDTDEPESYIENPIKSLIDRVKQFIEMYEDCCVSNSDFRVIFWLSR